MLKFTKQNTIGEILKSYPGTAALFMQMGMHCLGCPSAQNESIEQACHAHGTDVDKLLGNLNAYAVLHPKG